MVWEIIMKYLSGKCKAALFKDISPGNIFRRIILDQSKMPPESVKFWANVVSRNDVPFPTAVKDPLMIRIFKDYIWFFVEENEVIVRKQQNRNKIYFSDLINVYYIDSKIVKRRIGNHNPRNIFRNKKLIFNSTKFIEIILIKDKNATLNQYHNKISMGSYYDNEYYCFYDFNRELLKTHRYMINTPQFMKCYIPSQSFFYDMIKIYDLTRPQPDNNGLYIYKPTLYYYNIQPWQKLILDPVHQVAFLFNSDENEENYQQLLPQKIQELQNKLTQNQLIINDRLIKEEQNVTNRDTLQPQMYSHWHTQAQQESKIRARRYQFNKDITALLNRLEKLQKMSLSK